MSEYSKLKTELQSKKFSKMELEAEAQKKIKSLKELLAGSSIRSLKEIDGDLIFFLSKEYKGLKDKWTGIVDDIEKIEKELE
jgi:hypothetical protein